MQHLRLDLLNEFPFLNDENALLELAIKEKTDRIKKLEFDYLQQEERKESLFKYSKNIDLQISRHQTLLQDKEREQEAENALNGIEVLEIKRMGRDIDQLIASRTEMDLSCSQLQQQVIVVEEKLKINRKAIKMNQEDLKTIMSDLHEKEEDFLLLEKYKKIDNKEINDLCLEIKKLQMEEYQLTNDNTALNIDVKTLSIELKNTINAFDKANKERSLFIDHWESTLNKIQQQDMKLDSTISALNEIKTAEFDKKQVISLKEFEIKELEKQQVTIIKEIDAMERKLGTLESHISQGTMAVTELQLTSQHLQQELKQIVDYISSLKSHYEESINSVVVYEKSNAVLRDSIDDIKSVSLTFDVVDFKQIDKLISTQQRLLVTLRRQIDGKQLQFNKETELESNYLEKQKLLEMQQYHCQSEHNSISANIIKLQQVIDDQEEMIYNQKFNKMMLMNKLTLLKKELSQEDKSKLNELIAVKSKELEQLEADNKSLSTLNQSKLFELRQTVLANETIKDKLINTSNTLKCKLSILNKSNSLFNDAQNEFNALLVRVSLLELQIDQFNSKLNVKNQSVSTLQSESIDYQIALEKHQLESKMLHKSVLIELNAAEQIHSKLKIEMNDRSLYLNNLISKYQVLLSKSSSESEEALFCSTSMRSIELKEQESTLKSHINDALKELEAIEKTIQIMKVKQEEYNQLVLASQVPKDQLDLQDKLVKKVNSLGIELKDKLNNLKDVQFNLSQMELKSSYLVNCIQTKEQELSQIQSELKGLSLIVLNQVDKKSRALLLSDKLKNQIKTKRNVQVLVEDEDIYLREMMKKQTKILPVLPQ